MSSCRRDRIPGGVTNRQYLGERYSWIEATHGMRDELLAALSDNDLD